MMTSVLDHVQSTRDVSCILLVKHTMSKSVEIVLWLNMCIIGIPHPLFIFGLMTTTTLSHPVWHGYTGWPRGKQGDWVRCELPTCGTWAARTARKMTGGDTHHYTTKELGADELCLLNFVLSEFSRPCQFGTEYPLSEGNVISFEDELKEKGEKCLLMICWSR